MNTEYQLYMEFVRRSDYGRRIDEFSVPSFLSKSVNFIKNIAEQLSLKLTDVMKLFANKSVFQFFQKIRWNLDYLFKLIKDGHKAYTQLLSAISEYVSKTKVGKWTEDKLKDLDKWLQNHPKTKKIGGIVVAGLLIYIWFNMTFVGDVKYDFDLTDVYSALSGKYTLSTLFAGTSGTKLLMLFATGMIGLSFPWPGPTSVKFIYAMIKSLADWAKTKLQKEGKLKSVNTSKVNESLSYYLANAKERLKEPHTITDIQFNTTRRGDRYIQINYKYKYVPGKMVDPNGQFVSIFYDNENDLKRISRELKLKLKESVVNESTFILHYGQGRNRFAHELKAFTLKDALKKFIDMYKIPKEEWDKIVVRKNKWF